MSSAHEDSPAKHGPGGALETEELPYRTILVVGVITLATFAGGILWSTTILNRTAKEMNPNPTIPALINPDTGGVPEIGIVNQRMYEVDNRAELKRDAQMRRLHSYGYTDEATQSVHIPIERAMEMLVLEQKK